MKHAAHSSPITPSDYDALHLGDFYPGHMAGRLSLPTFSSFGGNGTVTLNDLFAYPLFIGEATTFTQIQAASLGAAGSFLRVGIYGHSAGGPGPLLIDAGQIDMGSFGPKSITISPSQTLDGLVWLAAVGQAVAPNCTRFTWSSVAIPWIAGTSGSLYSGGSVGYAYVQSGISGALPSPWGSTYNVSFAANAGPAVGLLAA